jgi:cytochrome c oxidase subunit II
MTRTSRSRWLAATLLVGVSAIALAACGPQHPNSVFSNNTEFNRDVTSLHRTLFILGAIVFVLVEALLLYVIVKFRRRPGQAEPKHVHGNTTLEVLWTAIPAVILLFIAIPTVRTIFRTQAKARAGALEIEVIGHQWWWEFRYPEYNITTANEVYIPTGRTVNFALKTADVIHAFWIPQLGGKRDLVTNHTNYLWFTADSTQIPGAAAWYGHCTEYCGASHANMRIRAFTVTPAQFESWVRGQQAVAAVGAVASPGQTSGPPTAGQAAADSATVRQGGAQPSPQQAAVGNPPQGSDAAVRSQAGATNPALARGLADSVPAPPAGQDAGPAYVFPREQLPPHLVPKTPVPTGLTIANEVLTAGDPARGQQAFMACIGCHYINGNPMARGVIGPNLTHVGSRTTIAAGLYPNDARHLALWIKNARAMKPGVTMPTFGMGQLDPVTKLTVGRAQGGLTDQQIADITAYLTALK